MYHPKRAIFSQISLETFKNKPYLSYGTAFAFVRIYIHVYAFVIPSAQVETKVREFIDLFEKFPDGGGETPAVPVCEDWHG